MADLASGSAEEGPPKEGITDATIEEGSPAEQLNAPRMSQKAPEVETKSSTAGKRVDTPTQTSRPESAVGFDFESRKRRNRHSLPTLSASHSRNVSNSSNDTLVWSPAGPSSASSPISSEFGQMLQDAYQQIIGEKLIDKVQELEQVNEDLTQRLAAQTERAKGLKTDLENCERGRELNFNIALRLYRKSGNLVLLERQNLFDQIGQLKSEILNRDWHIWSQDQLIVALGLDLNLYASQGHWLRMQQAFQNLAYQYGQMPQNFRNLEQQYEDLEDRHIDVCNMFKNLDGDHTELKVQLDMVKDERNRLEDNAAEAAEEHWALRVQRDRIVAQKAESERVARANEQFLAGLATRMFKQLVCMADILEDMGVNPMDNEQIALCQLAYNYLGLDAAQISIDLDNAGANRNRGIQDKHDESYVPENNAGEGSSSMSISESYQEPTIAITGFKYSSNIAAAAGKEMVESPDTFDARRRREVAAAEEKILGPLGLGFEDGSPTLKTKPIPESSKPTKVSKFMSFFPESPATPSKIGASLVSSGAGEIDQVTPARTGGTGGIARDQWETAHSDLREFTEVFRGPRAQPVDFVSPGAGTMGAEDGSHLREGDSVQDFQEGPFLGTNEDKVHDNALVEEMGVDASEDRAVHEDAEAEADGSKDGVEDKDNCHDPAAVLNEFATPGGHEGGFDGESNIDNQSATSSPPPDNGKGKSSDIWEDVSFGIGKQEPTALETQNPFTASPATAIEPESSTGSATSESSPETPPSGEGSPIFQDAGVGDDATNEEVDAIPSLPKETFNAPRFEDFDFGGSSSGVPFIGSENKSLATAGPTSEPTPTGIFNLPRASLAESPITADDPPRFEQDFNFGGSNRQVSFTASQATSSPKLELIGASSPLAASSTQNITPMIHQVEANAPKEVITDEHTSNPTLPTNNNKTKTNNAKEDSRKSAPIPKPEGPNRSQRRAASRERKAAEKKAQATAGDAVRRGRMAVARELMGG